MSPSETTTATTTTDEVELTSEGGYDDEQIRLMQEVCIVIDENDQPIRPGTKKECKSLYCSDKDTNY